jgi:hypothetical protein
MNPESYQAFTQALKATLDDRPDVIGFVVLGSTANQSRQPDDYSDHDFFVITQSGKQEEYRQDLTWLPNHANIVLAIRETEHGLKVLYQEGHLLEFAVFDLEDLNNVVGNDYAVLIDKANIHELAEKFVERTLSHTPKPKRDLGMVLGLLFVGAGRYARGEVLSAGVFIKTYALGHFLNACVYFLPPESDTAYDKSRLDNLDVFRRFEQVYPQLGAKVADCLLQPPLQAALGLLTIYETCFNAVDDYPADAVETVRHYINRVLS